MIYGASRSARTRGGRWTDTRLDPLTTGLWNLVRFEGGLKVAVGLSLLE